MYQHAVIRITITFNSIYAKPNYILMPVHTCMEKMKTQIEEDDVSFRKHCVSTLKLEVYTLFLSRDHFAVMGELILY